MFMEDLYQFKTPAVRDLAWVMRSPSLIVTTESTGFEFVTDRFCKTVYESSHQWLQDLDSCSDSLTEFLSRRPSSRLGYYFEDLVAYWLDQRISQDYFESHIKVSNGNRDLGEFDFLFQRGSSYYHWETAVKFYLYWTDDAGEETWFGPNANDTLAKKLDKLINHQIRMSQLPESKTILLNKNIDASRINPQIFLKGYLFYPLDQDVSNILLAESNYQLSSEHLMGWWLCVNELANPGLGLFSSDSLRWQTLPRRKWLAPRIYDPDAGEEYLKPGHQIIADLNGHFKQSDKSLLIAGYTQDRRGRWCEQSRGFVVSQHWPS